MIRSSHYPRPYVETLWFLKTNFPNNSRIIQWPWTRVVHVKDLSISRKFRFCDREPDEAERGRLYPSARASNEFSNSIFS